MPNWCSQNCFLRGAKNELEEFVALVNSLPGKEPVHENGFGPMWLGNLVAALGGDWEKVHCRGIIDPDDEAPAYFFGPQPDPDARLAVGEDGIGHFTTFSFFLAWSPAYEVMNLMRQKWPSFEFGYKATDDCGNFFCYHPVEGYEVSRYEVYIPDFCEISTDEKDVAVAAMLSAAGIERSDYENISFQEARDLLDEWLEEKDICPEIIEWEEE